MLNFNIYGADVVGQSGNCLYPNKFVVSDKDSFIVATAMDHVTAKYKGNYRSKDNFEYSDCIPLDCDNVHSYNPEDWITPFDVAMAMPGVCFVASYSKSHMKVKGDKSERPRFHVFFPIEQVSSETEYGALKHMVAESFPYFDDNALDSARFLYGGVTDVEVYEGDKTVVDFLEADDFADFDAGLEEIPQGPRNGTMSHIAGKIIKRYGNTDEALNIFIKKAEACNPPLPDSELKAIWHSASKFGTKVSKQDGYIPPEQYNSNCVLKPDDYSDVGQATVLAREYEDMLRYSPSTDYMVYNGSFWEESKPKSQGVSQDLTERQLMEAEAEIKKAMDELVKNGGMEILVSVGPKKAVQMFNRQQAHSYELYEDAVAYKKYAIKRRDSKSIAATLKEARPMLEVEQRNLDADEFMLNTPTLTYDLRQGMQYPLEHMAEHYITKQTAVDPSTDGTDIWADALNTFFVNDSDLIDYVQRMVGLSAIGKVYVEALIIAYGEGRNGKSTFWNVIARVLGTYSGNISADMLTVGCRRNVKPELAEAKGKRMLIAAELEEGMRLNTANVKQLCSTDEIYAEKKYKDPFSYTPTHTLVLYTNHLPKVGAIDKGTWRRLIVIPFDAKIEGNADIKNYADYLFDKAGGAILTWVIEGARKVIADNYKIDPPKRVREAIEHYKESNDWLSIYLADRCDVDKTLVEKSGDLYNDYRGYCNQTGEYTRSNSDFYTALEVAGFERYLAGQYKKVKENIHVLSGIVRCPVCGKNLVGFVSRTKKEKGEGYYKSISYYQCRLNSPQNSRVCSFSKKLNQEIIDGLVFQIIGKLQYYEEFKNALERSLGTVDSVETKEQQLRQLRVELRDAEFSKDKIGIQLDGLNPLNKDYDKKYDLLSNKLDATYDLIDELESKIKKNKMALETMKERHESFGNIKDFLTNINQLIGKMSDKEKKELCNAFIEHIDVFDEDRDDGKIIKSISFKFPLGFLMVKNLYQIRMIPIRLPSH